MDFPKTLLAKIRSLAVGVKAVLDGFFSAAGDFFGELRERIRPFTDSLLDKVPPEKRRFVQLAAVGAAAVLILFFSGVLLLSKGKSDGKEVPVAANPLSGIFIPPDELFLPDEPDFVPGVLLERERRPAWTADDAALYWQDPLKNGERNWRDQIEKTVDEIMESIP